MLTTAAVTAAAFLTTVSSASATVVRPMSASVCSSPFNDDCFYVNGSGTYVSEAWTVVSNATGSLHVQLQLPGGGSLNSTEHDGAGWSWVWYYNQNVPAGNYCSVLWQYNGHGGYNEMGNVCIGIH